MKNKTARKGNYFDIAYLLCKKGNVRIVNR